MKDRFPTEPDPDALPEPVTARLLERASELDAARRARSSVAELRAAATEAGISERAFDAALAELRSEEDVRVPDAAGKPRRRPRAWALASAFAALSALGAIALARTVVPAGAVAEAGAPMVEEALLLRCLSPGEAAELIRPLLHLPSNTVVHSPARAPRVLTIRATPEQLREVKSLLERYEGDGSRACTSRP